MALATQTSYVKKTDLTYNQFETLNEDYVRLRNRLIPKAEALANKRVIKAGVTHKEVRGKDGALYKWSLFTQFFCEEMNKLAIRSGLVRI